MSDPLDQVLAGTAAPLSVTVQVTQRRHFDCDPTVAQLERMRDNLAGGGRDGPRAVTARVRGDHSPPPGVVDVSAAATAAPAPRVSRGQR